MKRNNKSPLASRLIAFLSRTLLGLVFVFSGVVKAIDPLGTVYKIEDYLKAFGGFFTDLMPLATVAAAALILLELVLGVCMVLNVRTQWTSWLALLFYCVMTPLTLYIALTDPVSDCGCFGDAIVLTNWQTFWKNVVLIVLAIVLVVLRKSVYPLWQWYVELAIVFLTIGGGLAFMLYTRNHLPLMDFRPYKIGNHIPTMIANDQIHDFMLENEVYDITKDQNDSTTFTEYILNSTEPVTLIVMYDLTKSDKSQIEKVEALYNECTAKSQLCYILTGSGSEDVDKFTNEYPTLKKAMSFCDPVTLKTIVRANPGVITLHQGTIVDKYNIRKYVPTDVESVSYTVGDDIQDLLTSDGINEFEILDIYGENIYLDIFENTEVVTVAVMPELADCSAEQIEKVEDLYNECLMNAQLFYILTGSEVDDVINFSLEYPSVSDAICTCDTEILQTMISDNSGVIVIQDGTIIDKYNIKE